MALYGAYGRHEIDQCPINNLENAKGVIELVNTDLSQMLPKYKINKIIGMYHSGLEHTSLWIFDAEDAHLVDEFLLDLGATKYSEFTIVPLKTLAGVAERAKKVHGL